MRHAGLVALGLALAPAAQGAELATGDAVVIGADQVVHDDLYVAANRVEVLGTIDGDLILLASEARIAGVVTGDVLAAGGDIALTGDVVGSVRAAGGVVVLTAEVAQDAVIAAGEVVVPMQGRIGRDLVVAAQDASIEGIVDDGLTAAVGSLALESQIGGDARARTGTLIVGDGARIGGDLRYSAREEAEIAAGAIVRGAVERAPERRAGALEAVWWAVFGWLRALVGLFLAGLVFVAVFPNFTRRAEDALATRPAASLAVGLLVAVGVPLISVLVFLAGALVGGWWLGLVGLAMLAICMLVGVVVAGATAGHWLLAKVGRPSAHVAWALLVGLALLLLVGAVPFLGAIVTVAAVLFGLGALALAGLGGRRQAVA